MIMATTALHLLLKKRSLSDCRICKHPLGYDIVQSEFTGGIAAIKPSCRGVKLFDRFLTDKRYARPENVSLL